MTPHIAESAPINDPSFRDRCKAILDRDGALALPGFFTPEAVAVVREQGLGKLDQAYFCANQHNVYVTPANPSLPSDHPVNRQVVSSKGLIADDQIGEESPLKQLYNDEDFMAFIRHVVGEPEIHPYADPVSSVNLHFAKTGQELGWHFDNSSFAITLLIEKPEAGARFEYVRDLRNADAGEMNFEGVADLLDGKTKPDLMEIEPGTLVLFRGRNSIHRVSPNEGQTTRMIAVLAYNTKLGVRLSENSMRTFYGRVV